MVKSKIVYVLLLAVLAVFYIMYIDNMSLFLLIFAAVLPFVLFFIMLCTFFKTDADISASSISENKDSDISVDVHITNRSIFPVSDARVTLEIMNSLDSVPEKMSASVPVQALNSQTVSFTVSSQYCGKLIVTLKQIRIYDYIKLFSLRKKFSKTTEIVIMPHTYPVDIITDHSYDENTMSELYSKCRAGDDCSEVFNIRNYNDGDKINRIHWKLSMKQDSLMVKDYSMPVNCSILLLFEFCTDYSAGYMSKLDTLVETFSSVSESIAETEAVHDAGWYDVTKDLYVTRRIASCEDVASFLGTVMRSRACTETGRAYFRHIKADAGVRYSHLIYVTSCMTKEIFKSICSDENTERRTIIYITDDISILPDYFEGSDSERVTVIPVQCGKINQCLYEMLV